MNLDRYKYIIFKISLVICIFFFALSLFLGYIFIHAPTQMLKDAMQNAEDQAEDAVEVIDSDLTMSMIIANFIASDLTNGVLQDDQLVQRLKDTLNDTIEEYPYINGISAAYKPYTYDPNRRLYAPYYLMENGMLHLIQVEDVQDYTRPDLEGGTGPRTEWYHKPMKEGSCWIEPFFGTYTLIADYEVPFYRPNDSEKVDPAGTIGIDYSLDGIRGIVGSIDLGETGYGFVVTERGTVVSHPIQEYLGKNIRSLNIADESLQMLYSDMVPGNHRAIYNNFTGQTLWVFYELIPSTNWTLSVVFVEDEILDNISEHQRKLLIQISLTLIAFLFTLSIVLFGAYKGSSISLWAVAISFSVLCIFGTSFMWYLALNVPSDEPCQDVAIFDRVGLQASLSKQIFGQKQKTNYYEDIIQIPTGIFIQSLEFESATNIFITGYIWQNYSESSTIGASSPFFVFPESVDSTELEEAYRDDNLVGWHFGSILRQRFDYSKYPFDRQDVWIRLSPSDFHTNIVLIPDLDSYAVILPEFRPGLEKNIVIEGWNVQKSFFSYRNNSYNTNFGLENCKRGCSPELYFNVDIKRNFVGIFMSEFIPIAVVAFLLFAVLMISTKCEFDINLYGFSASAILAYCAALFFVLIVSHISLRQRLPAEGVIYLECFYFVLYIAILLVSINSIMFASNKKYDTLQYKNNLISKILYWPLITGLMLGLTLKFFY